MNITKHLEMSTLDGKVRQADLRDGIILVLRLAGMEYSGMLPVYSSSHVDLHS